MVKERKDYKKPKLESHGNLEAITRAKQPGPPDLDNLFGTPS